MKWEIVCKLETSGHRLFKDTDGRFAFADNSGSTPDLTEDGALYADPTRPIRVSSEGASVPVSNRKGSDYYLCTGCVGAAEVIERFPEWPIQVAPSMARLTRALAARALASLGGAA